MVLVVLVAAVTDVPGVEVPVVAVEVQVEEVPGAEMPGEAPLGDVTDRPVVVEEPSNVFEVEGTTSAATTVVSGRSVTSAPAALTAK